MPPRLRGSGPPKAIEAGVVDLLTDKTLACAGTGWLRRAYVLHIAGALGQVREIAKAAAPLRFLHITDPAGLRCVLDVNVQVAPDADTRRHSGNILVSAARRGDRRFRRGRGFAIRRQVGPGTFGRLTVTSNILMSRIIDHTACSGMTVHELTPDRLAGVALMVGGIDLIPKF